MSQSWDTSRIFDLFVDVLNLDTDIDCSYKLICRLQKESRGMLIDTMCMSAFCSAIIVCR